MLTICCIVYELSRWTKYRLPLVKGLSDTDQKRGALLWWCNLVWETLLKLYFHCKSYPLQSDPFDSNIIARLVWVRKCSEVLLFFMKVPFQWSHTRLIQRSCVISHCSRKGHLLATFKAAPHDYRGHRAAIWSSLHDFIKHIGSNLLSNCLLLPILCRHCH